MDDGLQRSLSLRYGEKLRVAWLWTWRQAVIAFLAAFLLMPVLALGVTGILTTVGVPDNAVRFILPLIPTLIFPALLQPLLFVMAFNKQYKGFRIEPVRPDESFEDVTITEAILPSLLTWVVTNLTVLPLLFLGSLAMRLTSSADVPIVPLSLALQLFAGLPLALGLVFRFYRARFHGFRFEVVREG